MVNRISIVIILWLSATCASAQQKFDAAGLKQLRFYEDSLQLLSKTVTRNENELERKNANYAFIKTLVTVLKTPSSFYYPFDSLKTISVVNAPDNRFRIMAWHVLNSDGTYRYYGTIQMNTGGNLQLFPLEDYSDFIANPEDTITDNRKWIGARYYKIIQPDASPVYTLLGWKGNSNTSTKKVIEVLSFKDGKPLFGATVFDGNGKTRDRVVFEYSKQATITVRYIAERQMIVFDHLSPSDPKTVGKFETYGPDMTYSGYQYKQGHWRFVDNLDMRNMPSAKDETLTDPKKVNGPR